MPDLPTRQSILNNVTTELADGSGRHVLVRADAIVTADIAVDGSIRISGEGVHLAEVRIFQSSPANANPFTEHWA